MQAKATTPQLAALAGVTGLMLVAGIAAPASSVNMRLSAREVGGLMMPPGMIMVHDTSAEAMRDMAAVLPREVAFHAAKDARGDRPLVPVRVDPDETKVFQITASVTQWNILGNIAVNAYAYNGQIPGPRLALTQGDKIRIEFHNELPEPSTMHWHGLIVPNEIDGLSNITSPPVPPGAATPMPSPSSNREHTSITATTTRTGSRGLGCTARSPLPQPMPRRR